MFYLLIPLAKTMRIKTGENYLLYGLSIGCGSQPIHWMNDSGFWVISRMSGLAEKEMLKTNSIMLLIMAMVGLIICMVGATLFPLK